MSARRRAVAAALAALGFASAASAHEIVPCLLDVRAIDGGRYAIVWRPPGRAAGVIELAPRFPPRCQRVEPVAGSDDGVTARFTLDCGVAGLAGAEIGVDGLDVAATDAVVHYVGEGHEVTAALRPDAPSMMVPRDASGSRLALGRTYVGLGVEHILRGPDHLLFVLGLLLLVRRTAAPDRRARAVEMARTVTAFTVAHSLTLALAVSGVVRVPPAPVEATIALSVLLLAVDLARPDAQRSRRPPWLVAFACGLLHGLGFAGALSQLGLPAGQIPAALLLFNVGVEAGQLAFVLVAVAAIRAARSVLQRAPRWASRAPAYVVGSLAAFWCIERIAAFWS
jgi:hypothetical protein